MVGKPSNHGFSYYKWSFWGVLGIPPFKETPISHQPRFTEIAGGFTETITTIWGPKTRVFGRELIWPVGCCWYVEYILQVIQAVTFLSPSWRSQNLWKRHVFTIPKRSQSTAWLLMVQGLNHSKAPGRPQTSHQLNQLVDWNDKPRYLASGTHYQPQLVQDFWTTTVF